MFFRPSKSESGAQLSMEAWVDAKVVPSAVQSGWVLVDEFKRGQIAIIGGAAPKFSFDLADKAGMYSGVTSVTTIVPGRIYHVVGTYDGSKLRIYVNGVLDATTEHPGLLGQIASPGGGLVTIGWGPRPSPDFAGLLDDVAIYNKALSPARIEDHYALGKLQTR